MKKKPTQKAILFCYVYLYLIIVHWHPVLYVLTFIFSAAPLGLEPVSSHSGGSSPPHSPFLPPQVFLFIQAAPQGSYLIQILLPVGLTQPCTPLRWHSWNHLWGVEPRNQTQFHIPCPGSEPPSHTENIPRKNLDLLQARSLLSAVPAPSPTSGSEFQDLIPAQPWWHTQLSIRGGIAEQREGRGLCARYLPGYHTAPKSHRLSFQNLWCFVYSGDLRFVRKCQKGHGAKGFLMTEDFLSHDLPEVDFGLQTVLPSALTGAGWQQIHGDLWGILAFSNWAGAVMPPNHPEYCFTGGMEMPAPRLG